MCSHCVKITTQSLTSSFVFFSFINLQICYLFLFLFCSLRSLLIDNKNPQNKFFKAKVWFSSSYEHEFSQYRSCEFKGKVMVESFSPPILWKSAYSAFDSSLFSERSETNLSQSNFRWGLSAFGGVLFQKNQ